MADWYMTPNGAGSFNGASWANACNPGNVPWGNMGSTDTLWFSGGANKAIYTTKLSVGKAGIDKNNQFKIRKSQEAGHKGQAIWFGGRYNELPSGRTSTGSWSSNGTPQDTNAIDLGSNHSVWIDGGAGRTSIHGWGRNGITALGSNGGKWTISNFNIFQNGRYRNSGEKGYSGYWTDDEGIELSGTSDITIEDCAIFDNGQDCLQNRNASKMIRLIVRRCLLGNTLDHTTKPHLTFQMDRHADGIQTFNGGDDCLFEDLVIINQFHGFVFSESSAPFTNSTIRRIALINCNCNFRFKSNNDNGNYIGHIIGKKWYPYYGDDGSNGFIGGTNCEFRGTGNTYGPMLYTGPGGWFIRNSPNTLTGPFYSDGSTSDPMPNQITLDPDFLNPGPNGAIGVSLTNDWEYRSIKPGNATVNANITLNYYGPMDWVNAMDGLRHVTFPYPTTASSSGNYPVIQSMSDTSISSGAALSYQIEAISPDGGTLNYSLSGIPGGSINSSGVVSASGLADGTYTARVNVSVNGKTKITEFLVTVGAGGGGGGNPILINPGTVSTPVNVQIEPFDLQATEPDGLALTYGSSNLPGGLTLNTSTGRITGTPTGLGSSAVTITATSTNGTATQNFSWIVTESGNSGATTIFGTVTQVLDLNEAFNFQIASTNSSFISGVSSGLPDWVALAIIQPEELPLDGNSVPVLGSIGDLSATVGVPYSLQLSATDADSGDTLTYSVTSGTLPGGLTLTAAGLLSGTPTTAETPTITIQVSDGNSGLDSETLVFTVSAAANNAPVLASIGDQTSIDGDTISLQLSATDADGGDTLTYSISAGSLPSGLSLNTSTGLISGDVDTVESQTFTVQVSDGTDTDTEEITWVVSAANSAPVLAAIGDQTNDNGDAVSITVSATDADGGDTLTYTVSAGTLPSGLSLNSSTGVISGTLDTVETQTLTIQVSDGTATDTEEITWTVSAVSTPVTVNLTVSSGLDDGDATLAGTGTNTARTTLTLNTGAVRILAFRFNNVTIPQGSTITAADFQGYVVSGSSRNDPHVTVHAEDIDDSPALGTANGNITDRTLTTASVTWDETDLSAGYNSAPDMTAVIQEVVNRAGWASGNSITIILTWVADEIRLRSYDGNSAQGAKLDVTYNS